MAELIDAPIATWPAEKPALQAYRKGERNPNAWRCKPLSEGEVLGSFTVTDPLTQYMFCSPSEGERGEFGERQVPGQPHVAFSHVYGAPGISACAVVTA